MGQKQSAEESLYNQVIKGDIEAIKSLHSIGTTLEWLDEEGKTPLMVACSSSELLAVAKTLIELGAKVTSFCAGGDGGTPLHHAARANLHQTVKLLLSHGANPLLRNLNNETPLDIARTSGYFEVVRAIESHVCFFSGWLRELYGPNMSSRKIWVVIIPSRLHYDPNLPLKLELVIYPTLLDSWPRTKIHLWNTDIEEPNLNESDPVLIIFDRSTKTRFAFTSGNDGDKQQVQCLYNSCKGIPQSPLEIQPNLDSTNGWGNSADESTQNGWGPPESKSQQATPKYNGWGPSEPNLTEEYNGWGTPKSKSPPQKSTYKVKTEFNGWGPSESNSMEEYNGWEAPKSESPPQKTTQKVEAEFNGWASPEYPSPKTPTVVTKSAAVPSAPPVPEEGFGVENSLEASRSTCVVCWERPSECACIPCGHMVVCTTCSDAIISNKGSCPVCRSSIHQIVKIFAV